MPEEHKISRNREGTYATCSCGWGFGSSDHDVLEDRIERHTESVKIENIEAAIRNPTGVEPTVGMEGAGS